MKQRSASGLVWAGLALVMVGLLGCGNDDKGTAPCTGTAGSPATMPYEEGNRWVYTTTETALGDSDTFERTDEVTGTRPHDGQVFAELRSILKDEGSSESDTSFSYLLQAGQELLALAEFDTTGSGANEINAYIIETLNESMPWKVAEFTSTSCDAWDLIDTSKTWSLDGGGELKVSLKMTTSNEGRVEVAVPSGTYSDVYVAKIEMDVTVLQNAPPLPPIQQRWTTLQRLYLRDGVGIVKEESESRYTVTGSSAQVSTTVSVLERFEPAP